MFKSLRIAATVLALACSVTAQAYDPVIDDAPSAEAMTFDLFIMRPLSLAGTIVGTAIYIVALPVNLVTLNLAEPARRLIVEPAKYTFVRDLGDLE
ncbi:MAG TPA: hypothetical protein VM240_00585 [Verrucomicrobiae bacterium]|nr:hypothetical protein [Verrucomicrobiae bacterium]